MPYSRSESQPPPTLVETPTGKALVLEAKALAQHTAQMVDKLDHFIRREVEPITTRLGLSEERTSAHERRISALERELRDVRGQLEQAQRELQRQRSLKGA